MVDYDDPKVGARVAAVAIILCAVAIAGMETAIGTDWISRPDWWNLAGPDAPY